MAASMNFKIFCNEPLTYSKIKFIHLFLRRFKAHDVKVAGITDGFHRDSEGTVTGVKEQQFPEHVPVDPIEGKKFMADPSKHFKTHAGIIRMKTISLPEFLDDNLRFVLAENECLNKGFEANCSHITEVLKNRQPPPEDKDVTEQYRTVLDNVIDKELQRREMTLSDMTEEEVRSFSKDVDKIAKQLFLKTRYNWKPLNYSGHQALMYTASRLGPNYAVMLQVLQEIKRDNPDYVPDFVFNHGSGTCSAVWAANTLWDEKVHEYICLDRSKDMVRLALKLMLTDVDDLTSSYIKGVHFRMFTPSTKNQYSLVISGYMLTEMNKLQRKELVQNLWKQTGDYLVLVENGSKSGYKLIMEAIEGIQDLMKSNSDLEGHIIAPCTHDRGCPKLAMKNPICSFEATYADFSFSRQITKNMYKQYEKYMYVIFKKGPRVIDMEYPRILEKSYSQKQYKCMLCCPDGNLHHCLINTQKSDRVLNLSLKRSKAGDLLPVLWSKFDPDLHEKEMRDGHRRIRSRIAGEHRNTDFDSD